MPPSTAQFPSLGAGAPPTSRLDSSFRRPPALEWPSHYYRFWFQCAQRQPVAGQRTQRRPRWTQRHNALGLHQPHIEQTIQILEPILLIVDGTILKTADFGPAASPPVHAVRVLSGWFLPVGRVVAGPGANRRLRARVVWENLLLSGGATNRSVLTIFCRRGVLFDSVLACGHLCTTSAVSFGWWRLSSVRRCNYSTCPSIS